MLEAFAECTTPSVTGDQPLDLAYIGTLLHLAAAVAAAAVAVAVVVAVAASWYWTVPC